jgi:hypothetical protein
VKKALIVFCLFSIKSDLYSQISDSTLCSEIERKYDEFEKETTIQTPIGGIDCGLIKVISKRGTTYYLSLTAPGSTANVGIKGVKIILSNKQILSFPAAKIDVDVSNGSYSYSAFITLPQDKLMLLKKFRVLKWKLYIYENEQLDTQAERFRNYVNCIISKK